MSGIIEILPTNIANQIAAGEVVNRPASVVKELIENSIDAGAKNIELIIKDGGRTLIQVIDNGVGMNENDSQKCFLAHATSKIKTSNDLYELKTMGFRGEALASISSISHIELRTKQEDDILGTKIELEGGDIKNMEKIACDKGCSIMVKNLFFNVPARRNFLKSDAVENNHILNEFLHTAIIHHNISFTYYNDNKLIHRVEASNFKKRIVELFGQSYNERLIPISEEVNEAKISGYIIKANYVKKNRQEQFFFVNNRFIKNHYLANAIDKAYQGMIAEKHYPSFFINLEVEPKNIDVNIHPTKTEVKFIDEKIIYAVLYASTKKSLGQFTIANQLDFDIDPSFNTPALKLGQIPKSPNLNYNPNYNPFEDKWVSEREKTNSENWQEAYKVEEKIQIKQTYDTIQVQNKYIITKTKTGILIINQNLASERILFEKFSQSDYEEISSQSLLFPYNHFFSPSHSIFLLEILPDLRKYGFVLEYQKDGSFNILSVPNNLNSEEAQLAIEELLFELTQDQTLSTELKHFKLALTMAKKLSIKEGEELDNQKILCLIGELFSSSSCEISPEGKKIMHKLEFTEIDNFFK